MAQSNVKNYADAEILERVESTAKGFTDFPSNYWLVGIRSAEDQLNFNDDKFYLFKGKRFVGVWRGTTHAGSDLINPTNQKGVGVIQADNIFYDSHKLGRHRGKVEAYIQYKALPIHRDNDRDRKAEELGEANWEIGGFNFHPESYVKGSTVDRETIDGWSIGCLCLAKRSHFDEAMRLMNGQTYLTICLLNEW